MNTHPSPAASSPTGSPPELEQLHGLLFRAQSTIEGMLGRLRESQTVLRDAVVRTLHDATAKLDEVSSATDRAATDIMDGLDRTLALVDGLDSGERSDTAADLREEIFGVMGHLQFQDITTQQLRYTSSLLLSMEAHLAKLTATLDGAAEVPAAEAPDLPAALVAFDPGASLANAEERQALADELLGQR